MECTLNTAPKTKTAGIVKGKLGVTSLSNELITDVELRLM